MAKKSLGIRVWLTAKQVRLIWPGLDCLAKNFSSYQEKGLCRNSASFRLGLIRGYDNGDWNQELMRRILTLHDLLDKKTQSGGYVRMNFIDLRIAIFAARTSLHVTRDVAQIARKWNERTKARFRFDRASLRKLKEKIDEVAQSLERYRKRANRLFLREHTQSEFRRKADEWRRFLRWLRYHLAYFAEEPHQFPTPRQYYREVIDHITGIASAVLLNDGYELPVPKDLRRVVRLYIKYGRQARLGPYDFSMLLRNRGDILARQRLLEFIEQRLPLKEKK